MKGKKRNRSFALSLATSQACVGTNQQTLKQETCLQALHLVDRYFEFKFLPVNVISSQQNGFYFASEARNCYGKGFAGDVEHVNRDDPWIAHLDIDPCQDHPFKGKLESLAKQYGDLDKERNTKIFKGNHKKKYTKKERPSPPETAVLFYPHVASVNSAPPTPVALVTVIPQEYNDPNDQ